MSTSGAVLLLCLLAADMAAGQVDCFKHLLELGGDPTSVSWSLQVLESSTNLAALKEDGRVRLMQDGACPDVGTTGNSSSGIFDNQQCLVTASTNTSDHKDAWVICSPRSCDHGSIQHLLSRHLPEYTLLVRQCSPLISDSWDAPDIAFLTFLAALFVVVTASTAYEHLASKRNIPHEEMSWCAWFSAGGNSRALVGATCPGLTLASVHGLRFLTAAWLLLCNRYRFDSSAPAHNDRFFTQMAGSWLAKPVVHGASLAADTFFVLSGMLTSYCFLRDRSVDETFGAVNVLKFYANRIVRIAAVYAVSVGLQACLVVHLGSGPMWGAVVGGARDACRAGWWRNLLFVNNYLSDGPGQQCVAQSWWLAADMQMLALSPLLLYPVWRWINYGRAALVTAALASLLAPFSYTYASAVYGEPQPSSGEFPSPDAWSLVRVVPYVAGISLGYLLHCTKCPTKLTIWIPKPVVVAGWVLCVMLGVAAMFSAGVYPRQGYPMTAACIASLGSAAWALAVCWLVFACEKGYGGCLYEMLSWRGFQPLGKLCYGVFLLQDMLFLCQLGSARTLPYHTHFSQVERALGDMTVLVLLSAVMYVSVELPSINICKHFFKPVARRGSNSSLSAAGGSQLGLAKHIQCLSSDVFSLKRPWNLEKKGASQTSEETDLQRRR